jgi:ATP-dependent RNA helicase SUPV3L1/SUV3
MTRHQKLRPHDISIEREEPRPNLLGVLGPTNTGKTHYAIERMLAHPTGLIGLPLRLLAREVYDRLTARRPAGSVALVTGEEKIVPPGATHWVATVEAMPLDRKTDFLAVDEIQLAADPDRGRVFTSRLLAARGLKETLFLGSETMRPILKRLFPEIGFQSMERFSALSYAGSRKVTRNPRRTAIVGFSADTVYSVAELIRRQRGGAAVVLGALSPRTRNAQAELYQSGEVDYLVATDAIGMGLNMDIDHVAFAAARKFDGRGFRDLRADELAQIAGRAGRHIRDGAFGETANCPSFDESVIDAIENHAFEPVEALQWRSDDLDLSSIAALKRSLEAPSPRPELRRARTDEDEEALMRLAALPDIAERVSGIAGTSLFWEVCQTPDFRKTTIDQHVRLLADVFEQIVDGGRIGEDWLAAKVAPLERTDGDIDTISMRISHVRTWTYLANRGGWVENAGYWQGRTRAIEDSLSDALHEKLTQRFVDRRTSVLLKKLRDEAPVLAGVTDDGDVIVEGQFVGRLLGFEFAVDPRATGADAKRIRGAAERALAPVLASRAAALATAESRDLQLKDDGVVWWRSSPVAELKKGPATLRPNLVVRGLDAISPHMRGQIVDRLTQFVASKIEVLLADLIAMKRAVDATGDDALTAPARGVAFRLVENFGAMSRSQFGEELKQLSQDERGRLRKLGVRFGEYTLHVPSLLKPAAARMMTLLWALWSDRDPASLVLPKPGLVSIAVAGDLPHAYYYALGYRPSGERAVRIDMLERLAQQIRLARTSDDAREGFETTSQMMSLVGCSGEDFEGIMRSLGYRKHMIKRAPRAAQQEVAAPAPDMTAPAAEAAPEPRVDGDAESAAPIEPIEAPVPADTEAAPQTSEPAPVPDAAPAQTEAAEQIEVAVWRMAPRRPPQPRPQERRDNRRGKNAAGDAGARADGQNKQDRGPREARGNGKKPPRKFGGDAPPRRFTSEPRRGREPDPNSPFAVLASLKATMSGRDGKPE